MLQKELDVIKKKANQLQDATKRARTAEEKTKIQALLVNYVKEGEQLKVTIDENRALAANKLQPPPVLEEGEAFVVQPKVNTDVEPN